VVVEELVEQNRHHHNWENPLALEEVEGLELLLMEGVVDSLVHLVEVEDSLVHLGVVEDLNEVLLEVVVEHFLDLLVEVVEHFSNRLQWLVQ